MSVSHPDSDAAIFATLRARAETNAAERDAALAALVAVLRLVDRKSYLTPEQQAVLWNAEAILAEAGRSSR
jgi:hypothetical protein